MISPLEGDAKEPGLHKKHTDLKQRMRDLNHGFERLRKLSHEGFTEDSGEPKLPQQSCNPDATLVTWCLGSRDEPVPPAPP